VDKFVTRWIAVTKQVSIAVYHMQALASYFNCARLETVVNAMDRDTLASRFTAVKL